MALAARLLFLVSLAITPALCVVAYTEYELRQTRQAELREAAEQTTARGAIEMRNAVSEVQRISAVVAKLPEIRAAAGARDISEPCSALLVGLRREYPGQLEFGVANSEGTIVCTTQGIAAVRQVGGSHVTRAIGANAFAVGGFRETPDSSRRYLTFAYPIRNEAGNAIGAVLTGLDLRSLADRLRALAGPDQSVLSVHDRDLTFLVRVPSDGGLIGRKPPAQVQALSALANKGAMEATGADGRTRIGAIVSMALGEDGGGTPDLSVAFGLSRDAAFKQIDTATSRTLGLLLISLVLAALAAWYGGRQFIRRPIERLLAAAARWREGDYGARVDLRERSSELGRLANAFEEMAESLGRREIDHRLMINELNHRVKNTLATVQSVAAQSFRDAADVSQAQQNFEGRLLALSRTHDVLTRQKWDSASIVDIVAETIAPYVQGASRSRFRIEGPALRLPATIVLPLSMGLHELCTNAVKHGALSNQSGEVGITWNVSGDARELRLRWKESGGPVVYEPSRRGFGTRLVERILAQQLGGEVQLRFAPQGVSCELNIPLAGTEAQGPAELSS